MCGVCEVVCGCVRCVRLCEVVCGVCDVQTCGARCIVSRF